MEVIEVTSVRFEFRGTRNVIRVVTRSMAEYTAIMRHLEDRKLL
jgi:hypothetical protein